MAKVFGARFGTGKLIAAVPAVLAASFLFYAFVLRSHPDAGDDQRFLFVGAACLGVLSLAALLLTRCRIVVGDDGIQIRRGLRSIALGRPKKLRCGQFEREVHPQALRHGLLRDVTVPITHVWVAVEGTSGQRVLFTTTRGVLHRDLDWPIARPPAGDPMLVRDLVGLREAIGAHITAG